MYVLFDAWYAAESVLNLLEAFGWLYGTRVKKNRLFNGARIDKTFRHFYGRKTGKLKRINHQILIVKDGARFLLTNDLSLPCRASEETLSSQTANRRSLSALETGVRLGQMPRQFTTSAKGAFASGLVCFLLGAK